MGQRSSSTGGGGGGTALGTASTTAATNSDSSSLSSSRPNSNSNQRSNHTNQTTRSTSSTSTTALAHAPNVANMSPRSRFRHEMARRVYGSNSSEILFRLFQMPSPGSPTSNPSTNAEASSLSSSNPASGGLNSDLSSDEDEPHWNHNLSSLAHSLPFFFGMRDLKCFVCNKLIPADDVEAHIMMCLTKPRLTYNEDVLADDKGECVICLEVLEKGQRIARLQCLCIYHKHCIDDWLSRSQSCPGHPPD